MQTTVTRRDKCVDYILLYVQKCFINLSSGVESLHVTL